MEDFSTKYLTITLKMSQSHERQAKSQEQLQTGGELQQQKAVQNLGLDPETEKGALGKTRDT